MQAEIYLWNYLINEDSPRFLFSNILYPFLILFLCNKQKMYSSSYPPRRLLDLKKAFGKVSF